MSKEQEGGVKIGFFGLLALAFIVLKLTGHIQWSWLWILSPIWLPIACQVIIPVALGISIMLIEAVRGGK